MTRRLRWYVAAGLILLVFAAYGNTLYFGFLLDDEYIILRNRFLSSVAYLPHLFVTTVTAGADATDARYRPILLLTHFLDVRVWGYDPFGHHLTNVLLHAALAVLVFRLLARLAGDLPGAIGAAAFALHPLQSIIVPTMGSRGDALVLVFICAGLLLFRAHPRWSAVCGVLAMGSKESGALFPALLALYDVASGRPASPRRHAPFWLLTAGYLVVRAAVLHAAVPDGGLARTDPYAAHLSYRFFTYLSTLPQGLSVCLWPFDVYHLRIWPYYMHPLHPMVVAGALLAAGLIAATVLAWRRGHAPVAAGLAWFLLSTLPTSGLVAVVYFVYADHWFVLPMLGLTMAGTFGLAQAMRGPRWSRYAAWACAGAVLAAFARWTPVRNELWRNPYTFYTYNLAKAPDLASWQYELGLVYEQLGRPADAIPLLERAIALGHQETKARFHLGLLLMRTRNYARAAQEWTRVAELEPGWATIWLYLGSAYLQDGRTEQALAAYRRARAVDPGITGAYPDLAHEFARLERAPAQ